MDRSPSPKERVVKEVADKKALPGKDLCYQQQEQALKHARQFAALPKGYVENGFRIAKVKVNCMMY